jgi:hypothetical protein
MQALRNLAVQRGVIGVSPTTVLQEWASIATARGMFPGTQAYSQFLIQQSSVPYIQLLQTRTVEDIVAPLVLPRSMKDILASSAMGVLSSGAMSVTELGSLLEFNFGRTPLAYTNMLMMAGIRDTRFFPQRIVRNATPFGFGVYSAGELESRALQEWYQARTQAYQMESLRLQMSYATLTRGFELQGRGIEDQLIAAQRGHQEFLWGIQQRQMEISFRQAQSDLARQRRLLTLSMQQMQMQRQWQIEDIAIQRQRSAVTFEWNLEDINEAIRYSMGLERRRLMRQRDRMLVQREWQLEDFARTESRQSQLFELEKRRMDENMAALQEAEKRQKELRDLQRRSYEEQIRYTRMVWELEDKRRQLQRRAEDEAYRYQTENMNRTRTYYESIVFPYQNRSLQLQKQAQDAWASFYASLIGPTLPGGQLRQAWEELFGRLERKLRELSDIANGLNTSARTVFDFRNAILNEIQQNRVR